MRARYRQLLLTAFALLLLSFNQISAQSQNSSNIKPEVVLQHHVRLQLLVASNIVTARTDYPPSLEGVVKQLKSSLSFKSHYLVATYLYEIADGGALKINDATYKPFESGGGLALTPLSLTIENVKLNPSGDSTHISKFRFEMSRTMFTGMAGTESGNSTRGESIRMPIGIETEVNLREGVPTIVGTTSSGLSDGVLALIITIDHSGAH